ncbi:helix-turn-helix domain-containing protein [soil metagenome]
MAYGEQGRQSAPQNGGQVRVASRKQHNTCCCPLYHEAIELIGRRWTGAIVGVLIVEQRGLRFKEVAAAVPELSDRLLSERMKELESRGLVIRTVVPGRPVRVEYALTEMGRELAPAVHELERWARRWLAD